MSPLDSLPGLPMPLPQLAEALAAMWDVEPGQGDNPLADSHATQLNLVLHMGEGTSDVEALRLFDDAILFAQRYPCRIVVLCDQSSSKDGISSKLFSQCYIGSTFRDMCCCEAVLVAYDARDSHFLDNQVPLWLEPDLPTYYWLHRVRPELIERQAMGFIRRCNRVLYDYSVDGGSYRQIRFPRPGRVKDLSLARTLSLRQALGQYLSAQSPAALAGSLRSVVTRYERGFRGEAGNLSCWQEYCVDLCRKRAGIDGSAPVFRIEEMEVCNSRSIEIDWVYGNGGKFFRWSMRQGSGTGDIAAYFGGQREFLPIQVNLLPPDRALAETLFFNDWTT